MLSITSLTESALSYTVIPGRGYYTLGIQATVNESSPELSYVAASLDWNDGSPPVQFSATTKPLVIDTSRDLLAGSYFVTLLAWNYRGPVADQTAVHYKVDILPEQTAVPVQDYVFGPILPLDNEAPNAEDWNLDMGTNLQVLKSSVKMLLITSKGERLMNPPYGTNLRRIVFEHNSSIIPGIAQQEIEEALNQFEPRIGLEAIDVRKISDREVLISARFISKINQSSFTLSLPFTQSR